MQVIIISFFIYLLTYMIFVVALRTTGRFHSPRAQMGFFLAGLLADILVLWAVKATMPLTALALYCSLSFATVVLSASPLLAEASPALTIFLLVRRKAPVSQNQLIRAVAPTLGIKQRLTSLAGSGLVDFKNHRWYVSQKGRLVFRVITLFRKTMSLKLTG